MADSTGITASVRLQVAGGVVLKEHGIINIVKVNGLHYEDWQQAQQKRPCNDFPISFFLSHLSKTDAKLVINSKKEHYFPFYFLNFSE